MLKDDAVTIKHLETMYIVFHPKAGLVTTEPYEENAMRRAKMLQEKYPDEPVYLVQTDRIIRINTDHTTKRIYKLERERLIIEQEFI